MDLTVAAVPFYFGSMGVEHAVLRRRALRSGASTGDYERRDTLASLAMGTGSLVVPVVLGRLSTTLAPSTRTRWGRILVGAAAGAATAAAVSDAVVRLADRPSTTSERVEATGTQPRLDAVAPATEPRHVQIARAVSGSAAVTAIGAGGWAVTAWWFSHTTPRFLFDHRVRREASSSWPVRLAAIAAWDLGYYWNHRLMHERRFLWAIHVVHHSSERYNLSTALRQPWADAFGTFVPQVLALFGVTPAVINDARAVNLIYQFWIHTETIGRLGPLERHLNTPSHHRVHHGSNPAYLDRNYGSIVIWWDRLFRTFAPEEETVVYGLTKNISTFNPLRIATHVYAEIARDVRSSRTWKDRVAAVVGRTGWSIPTLSDAQHTRTAAPSTVPEARSARASFA